MQIACEGTTLKADGVDLAFMTVKLTDSNGVENLNAKKEITVSVEGAGTQAGEIKVRFEAEGCEIKEVVIDVK